VVATDARRKEVYLASYDATGRRLDGPHVARPGDAATRGPVVGQGPELYPQAFPNGHPPVLPGAGWVARVVATLLAEEGEALPPEPLYLRRPDAAEPHRPKQVS
jgi:tRNA threonylcarbamoyladenosine biosynthesis protein TsaB